MNTDTPESKEARVAKARFRNLLTLALADGMLDKNELEYLFRISEKFYLTRQEIQELLSNTEQLDFEIPESDEDRLIQLFHAVELMMLDGEADQREYQVCMSVAAGLGFNAENVENTVDKMIELVENNATKEDVLNKMGEFS